MCSVTVLRLMWLRSGALCVVGNDQSACFLQEPFALAALMLVTGSTTPAEAAYVLKACHLGGLPSHALSLLDRTCVRCQELAALCWLQRVGPSSTVEVSATGWRDAWRAAALCPQVRKL